LLHPPLLEEVGLDAAIHWFTEGFSQRSGIRVWLDIAPNLQRLDKDMEIAIFRILQECLTNIHRHSGGKTAEIRLAADGNQVSIEVRDDGNGIPSEKRELINSAGLSGVGLRGMRERLRAFGGTLEIQSSPSGTVVTAVFPLVASRVMV
jgi:signal transduction histidine kinase